MKRFLWILGLALALAESGAFAATPTIVTVIGQNDPAIDRQAIQDAIDAASPNTTIRLLGTFALDGERIVTEASDLTIEGEYVDDDGDGSFQEDWSDGRDNDGDGAIDEDDWDTVLRGVVGPDGEPVTDDGFNGLFNRGFVVDGATLEDLVIRNLRFTNFYRAIEMVPEWESPTGRCEDRTRIEGSATRVTIEGSRFDDNVLGVVMLGDVRQSTIRYNVFQNHDLFGAVVEGGENLCPFAGGGGFDLILTSPESVTIENNVVVDSFLGSSFTDHTTIRGNVIEDAGLGIYSFGDEAAQIDRNETIDCSAGIVVDTPSAVSVSHNVVTGGFVGIDAYFAADHGQIVDNQIDGALIGTWVEFDSSGYRLIENSFTNSGFVDVLLEFGSSGNLVVNDEGPPITVLDLGTDNKLEGNIIPF